MGWRWDATRRRYVDDAGRVISQAELLAIRDALADGAAEIAATLAGRYTRGEITLAEFQAAFDLWISETVTAGYMLGRGGAGAMQVADLEVLAEEIRKQQDYARDLVEGAQRGEVTPGQIEGRAPQYAGGAVSAFDQGRAATYGGDIDLPVYPADGGTSCYGNCRCSWEINDFEDRFEARWITEQDGRVCPECEQRGIDYALIVIPKRTTSEAGG